MSDLRKLTLFAGVAVLAAAMSMAGLAAEDASGGPVHRGSVRPYMLAPAHDGVTVCWISERECVGRLRWQAEGVADWREAAEPAAGRFHSVRVARLQPATEHRIEAFSGDTPAGDLAYRSLPAPGADPGGGLTFFVYGDSQARSERHGLVAAGVLAEARRLNQFTFILHLGDFTDKADDHAEWARQFFRPAQETLRRLPIVPVRGNHDGDGASFRMFFPQPEPPGGAPGDTDRLVDCGPIRVLVLDRFAPESTAEARRK
ncbi:MAG TPA: metallophosphoesterase [Planctomycetota bacterium]|nr:metallophosphoesterase [Planctomycetota bacterium]